MSEEYTLFGFEKLIRGRNYDAYVLDGTTIDNNGFSCDGEIVGAKFNSLHIFYLPNSIFLTDNQRRASIKGVDRVIFKGRFPNGDLFTIVSHDIMNPPKKHYTNLYLKKSEKTYN